MFALVASGISHLVIGWVRSCILVEARPLCLRTPLLQLVALRRVPPLFPGSFVQEIVASIQSHSGVANNVTSSHHLLPQLSNPANSATKRPSLSFQRIPVQLIAPRSMCFQSFSEQQRALQSIPPFASRGSRRRY